MNGLTPELLGVLVAGGTCQAVLLVVGQAVHLKRSSLGARLESLRTEVAKRDDAIRVWVRDSLAQMEADNLMDTRADIRESVRQAMTDETNLKVVAEYTAGAIMTRLLESKHVRRELALLAEDDHSKRRRQRSARTGEVMAHRVWATGVDEPGTVFVGTTGEDYVELNPDVETVLDPGGTVAIHYAEGSDNVPQIGPNAPTLPGNGKVFQGVRFVALKADSGSQAVLVSLP